jgi:hypothetical protein
MVQFLYSWCIFVIIIITTLAFSHLIISSGYIVFHGSMKQFMTIFLLKYSSLLQILLVELRKKSDYRFTNVMLYNVDLNYNCHQLLFLEEQYIIAIS